MGCAQLLLAVAAMSGTPAVEHVLLDVRVVAPDPITGLGKVVSEPKVITQAGRPARLRHGGSQATVGADGAVELVATGLTVELCPTVRRTMMGELLAVSGTITHRIVAPGGGFAERTADVSVLTRPGKPHPARIDGDKSFAPLAITITPRLVTLP